MWQVNKLNDRSYQLPGALGTSENQDLTGPPAWCTMHLLLVMTYAVFYLLRYSHVSVSLVY